jgi:hypothetical protein
MFWSYRLYSGNIIHNLKHKCVCMGMLEICKISFPPTPNWHSTHTYISYYVFCCMIMVSKTKKHVAITDEFNKSLLCLTAVHVLILLCHNTTEWSLLKFSTWVFSFYNNVAGVSVLECYVVSLDSSFKTSGNSHQWCSVVPRIMATLEYDQGLM